MSKNPLVASIICAFCGVLFLSSCGGGGSSDSNNGVRVFHGSLESPPVVFQSSTSSSEELESVRFAQVSTRVGIQSGEQVLLLSTPNSSEPAVTSLSADLDGGRRYTLLLLGSELSGFRTRLLEDESTAPSGEVLVRLINVVEGTSAVELSLSPSASSGAVSYGESSGYLSVDPGFVRFRVEDVETGFELASFAAEIESDVSYTVFVAGERGLFVHASLAADNQ